MNRGVENIFAYVIMLSILFFFLAGMYFLLQNRTYEGLTMWGFGGILYLIPVIVFVRTFKI